MNEHQIALRIIGRLEAARGSDKWPVTLPTPTTAQLIDWIESQNPAHHLAVYNRIGGSSACDTPEQAAHCRELLAVTQRLYESGEIDAETYTRLTDTRQLAPDRRQTLRARLMRWRPAYVMHNRNNAGEIVQVCQMLDSDGQPYDLTCEQGIWYRHNGKAYVKP